MADYGKLFEKFLGLKGKDDDNIRNEELEHEENEGEESGEGNRDSSNSDVSDNNNDDTKQDDELDELKDLEIEINIDGIDTKLDVDTVRELAEYGYEFQNINRVLVDTIKELKDIDTQDVVAMKEFLINKDINSLKYLLEKSEIDLEQLEEIESKEPEVENDGISDTVKKYINKLIKKDDTLVERLNQAVATLDNKSIAEISTDDNKHIAFINAVQSGDFEKYLPRAKALTLKNPALSLLEAWAYAYTEANNEDNNKKEPKNTDTGNTTNNNEDLSYEDYFQKFIQD